MRASAFTLPPFEIAVGRRRAPLPRRELRTDDGATFDRELTVDATALSPLVTWGTNPGQGVPLGAAVPDPEQIPDEGERQAGAPSLGRARRDRRTRGLSAQPAAGSGRAASRAVRPSTWTWGSRRSRK